VGEPGGGFVSVSGAEFAAKVCLRLAKMSLKSAENAGFSAKLRDFAGFFG
jgi:hypothetical protein